MELFIEESEGGIPIIRIVGEIDLHTCPELRQALHSLTEAGKYRIVLNLGAVAYVDSAALGVLVDTQRRVKENHGEVYLTQITSFVLRAFEITRLIRIFRVLPSVEEAVAAAEEDSKGELAAKVA